eukprot:gene19876-21817_t
MAPTIQDGQKERRESGRIVKSDFVCRMKYSNALPDIPFDAKFITYPFEANRFIHYKPTSLERSYKHDLLTEPDLGVTIDLVDPDTYVMPNNAEMDPADEKLLEEEISVQQDHKRVGFNVKKKMKGHDLYKDRDAQIVAIEGSFDAAKKPITTHHTNPRLKPVEVLPVFPDFQFWSMACAHVIFDTEPSQRGKAESASLDEMSHAMIRGMEDESGDQFVAYFLPSERTLRKRKRTADQDQDKDDEEENDYKLAREYNWSVKNKASVGYEENYFFALRKGEGVFYDELQTRVKLNKRRTKGGAGGVTSAVSKLIVKDREPTEAELQIQKSRLVQLENVAQEEEEDNEFAEDEEDSDASEPEDETKDTLSHRDIDQPQQDSKWKIDVMCFNPGLCMCLGGPQSLWFPSLA